MKKILLTLIVFATLFGANIVHAENLIQGGTFENVVEADFNRDSSDNTKITSIKNNSVIALFKRHSWIVGISNDSYSGNQSLHITQNGGYYPVSFQANLKQGGVYKFSARIKAVNPSAKFSTNLAASTIKPTSEKEWSNSTDIKAVRTDNKDSGYKIENPWSEAFTDEYIQFTGAEWKLLERVIYVANPASAEQLTVYLSLVFSQNTATEYYIDDVSLVELDPEITIYDGYSKVYAANKDTLYTYKAQSYHFLQNEIVWSLEGDTNGASLDSNGNLTITKEASGNITIVASSPDGTVTCRKDVEIVPFTANNFGINVNGTALNGFSADKESYIYNYRGETAPTVTTTGNQQIIENENTVFVEDSAKTYDIIFKKLPDFNENLLYNGGFEDGVIYSELTEFVEMTGTLNVQTQNVHSGRYAVEVVGRDGSVFIAKASVTPGKYYLVNMWVKNSSSSAYTGFRPTIYSDTSGVTVEYCLGTGSTFTTGKKYATNSISIPANRGWVQIQAFVRVTGDVSAASLRFGLYTPNTLTYYVDDFSLYELDMSEFGGAYVSPIYKTANDEIAKSTADINHMELVLYNPQGVTAGTNLLVAEYDNGRLLKLTKEQFTTSTNLVEITNKPLALQPETDSISILAWDTGFSPDIKASNIK